MIKRNHTYSVGDTEYSMEGYKLVCKTAGTTAPTPINMGGGQIITDGTVEWEVTLGEDAMPSEITETWTINSLNTTWGSSVDPHEIPANGWANVYKVGSYQYASGDTIFDKQVGFTTTEDSTVARTNFQKAWTVVDVNSASMQVTFPVRKGEHVVYRSKDKPNTVWNVTFCYSVGEAKRLGLL